MSARNRLPDRRACESVEFTHHGMTYIGSVSRTADGRVAEVFLNVSAKVGTQTDEIARDAAVSASLALQYGCPAKALRDAMAQDADGDPAGAVGKLLDLIEVAA